MVIKARADKIEGRRARVVGVSATHTTHDVDGRGYFAECAMWNAESCQGVICGKSSAERSANYSYPIVTFPHSAAEKFRISADCKTAVCSRCTSDVQPMHSSVQRPKKLHLPHSETAYDQLPIAFLYSQHNWPNLNSRHVPVS